MKPPLTQNVSSFRPLPALRPLLLALLLALCWCSAVALRQRFDPAHYQTIDAGYYLQLASGLGEGTLPVLDQLKNRMGKAFSPYPYGYPLLLRLAMPFSPAGLSPAWLVHSLGILGLLLLWARRFPVWPWGIWLFTDTALELGSSTGAEWIWILLLMGWAWTWASGGPYRLVFLLVLAVIAYQIRYATVFLVGFAVLEACFFSRFGGPSRRSSLGFAALFLIFVLGQGLWETWLFGQPTGGDRYPNSDTFPSLMQQLGTEVVNQICLFRNPAGSSLLSFLAGWVLQLGMGVWLLRSGPGSEAPKPSRLPGVLLRLGAAYLVFMVLVRGYFYFAEGYDFRLIGPGFLWIAMGMLLAVSLNRPGPGFWSGLVFLGLAYCFALPWKPILYRMQEKIWLQTRPVFGFTGPILHPTGNEGFAGSFGPNPVSLPAGV